MWCVSERATIPSPHITPTSKLDILVELDELYQKMSKLTLTSRFDESPDRDLRKIACRMHNTNPLFFYRDIIGLCPIAQSTCGDVGKRIWCCWWPLGVILIGYVPLQTGTHFFTHMYMHISYTYTSKHTLSTYNIYYTSLQITYIHNGAHLRPSAPICAHKHTIYTH